MAEQYHCNWNLPLMYGSSQKLTKYKDVFKIHDSGLDVAIVTDEIPSTIDAILPSHSHAFDRWCDIAPCYGDHTLCLFHDDKYSNLCEPGYTVGVPTPPEQVSLINTLNSMRNRVAMGQIQLYKHLPKAANMKQVIYDLDLENMASAWLRQCLPGPAPCVALDVELVSQLECTKSAKYCCMGEHDKQHMNLRKHTKCIPPRICFISAIIGCLHSWFNHAGSKLEQRDIRCVHLQKSTYATAQILWAHTDKIGCAYGQSTSGNIKVICNFAPGAPFVLRTQFYCGIIYQNDITNQWRNTNEVTDLKFLARNGINLTTWGLHDFHIHSDSDEKRDRIERDLKKFFNQKQNQDTTSLSELYKEGWLRNIMDNMSNGTLMGVARLVTRYEFIEGSEAKCDSEEAIYQEGAPGSACEERGRRYNALCYDFTEESPGYRAVAVIAPVALFSLILYDLFSSVMRQTTY